MFRKIFEFIKSLFTKKVTPSPNDKDLGTTHEQSSGVQKVPVEEPNDTDLLESVCTDIDLTASYKQVANMFGIYNTDGKKDYIISLGTKYLLTCPTIDKEKKKGQKDKRVWTFEIDSKTVDAIVGKNRIITIGKYTNQFIEEYNDLYNEKKGLDIVDVKIWIHTTYCPNGLYSWAEYLNKNVKVKAHSMPLCDFMHAINFKL